MNSLKKTLATFAFSLAGLSSANAHDSFSLGVNIGGYGYTPPTVVHYFPAPSTVYYGAPTIYYGAPTVRYQYYDNDRRGHHGHGNRWNPRGGHHGAHHWDRGRGDRGHDHGHRGSQR